jgi:hypothetical protein
MQNDVLKCVKNLNPTTSKGEEFITICDEESKIIVFGCHTNLEFLCNSETVYMDGTFQFCTKYYTQFFTKMDTTSL